MLILRLSYNTVTADSVLTALKTLLADDRVGATDLIIGELEPSLVLNSSDLSDEARHEAESPDKDAREEELLLYPPRLLGYSTEAKMWGQFGVDQTEDVTPSSFSKFKEKLQLDENYKTMIQALVDEHEGNQTKQDNTRGRVKDVIDGKGKGLVLLLHGRFSVRSHTVELTHEGPPGVGKTVSILGIFKLIASSSPLSAMLSSQPRQLQKPLESLFLLSVWLKLASMQPKPREIWSRCSPLQESGRLFY